MLTRIGSAYVVYEEWMTVGGQVTPDTVRAEMIRQPLQTIGIAADVKEAERSGSDESRDAVKRIGHPGEEEGLQDRVGGGWRRALFPSRGCPAEREKAPCQEKAPQCWGFTLITPAWRPPSMP
jgi:hypothetical protein